MKKILLIILSTILAFAFMACGSSNSTANSAANNGKQNAPQDDGSIRGIVISISNTQIEIAKMNDGGRQGDGNPPSGRSDRSRQKPSSDASGSPQPQQSMDTSNMEKVQYTIDGNTKIVKRVFQGQAQPQSQKQTAPEETTAALSDIKQGTMVSITTQSGNDKAAAKIVITEGFGQRRNGQPPQDSGKAVPQSNTSQGS